MKENKTKISRPVRRLLAVLLAVVLLISTATSFAIAVSIKKGSDSQAENYLAEETEYANASWLTRLAERLKALGKPESVLDYYRLGSIQIAQQDYEAALSNLTSCQDALAYGDDESLYLELLLKRGCLLTLLNRYTESVELLNQSLALDPAQTNVYLILAQDYAGMGNAEKVNGTLNECLALDPSNDRVRATLAECYFAQGAYASAEEQYRTLTENKQVSLTNVSWFYNYGRTCMQLNEYEKAEQALTAALSIDPRQEDGFYYRGVCRMALADYTGVIADMTQAIQYGSAAPTCLYSRGLARILMTPPDYTAAMEDLQSAVTAAEDSADEATGQQAQNLINEIGPLLE